MMNPKQKKIATICCIGCVILAWRVYVIVTKYMPSPAEASSAEPTNEIGAAGAAANLSNWIEIPPQVMAAQEAINKQAWGRDPFALAPGQIKPKVTAQAKEQPDKPLKLPPQIKFSGVSRSNECWLAAINGAIYRVGDHVDEDFKVREIEANSVTLSCDGWAFEFALGAQKPNVRRIGERP